MPHIAVSMYPGRDEKIKTKLANRLQDVVAEELGIEKGRVSVSITDVSPESWEAEMRKLPTDSFFVNKK